MNIYDRIINMLLEARIEDYLERLDEVGPVKKRNKEAKNQLMVRKGIKASEYPAGLDYKKIAHRAAYAEKMARASPHTQPEIPYATGVKGLNRHARTIARTDAYFKGSGREVAQQADRLPR
jgi:hypothetical protein